MAKINIRVAESAEADLAAIRTWYINQDVPGVGKRLINGIMASIDDLADHPEIGRIVHDIDSSPPLRQLIRPPFRIVYRRDPECVRIVRVLRNEQHLLKILE